VQPLKQQPSSQCGCGTQLKCWGAVSRRPRPEATSHLRHCRVECRRQKRRRLNRGTPVVDDKQSPWCACIPGLHLWVKFSGVQKLETFNVAVRWRLTCTISSQPAGTSLEKRAGVAAPPQTHTRHLKKTNSHLCSILRNNAGEAVDGRCLWEPRLCHLGCIIARHPLQHKVPQSHADPSTHHQHWPELGEIKVRHVGLIAKRILIWGVPHCSRT
jgi:hypothetical protein